MKLSIRIISIALLLSTSSFAQGYEKVGWIAKFGVAGGFTPVWLFPKVDEINTQLQSLGINDLSKSGMIAYGGSGYTYLMFINNFRLGGYGFGGSLTESGIVNTQNVEVEYSYGSGGITIEYTIPYIKKIALSVGLMIGAGSQEVQIYSNNSNFDWTSVWENAGTTGTDNNYHRTLKNNFVTFAPVLNLDVPFNRFLALRLGGGYIVSAGNEWKVDNDNSINNVPGTLNGDTFFIQFGLFAGFFAF